jgi:DNA repair protein RadA/Sms
MFFCRACKESLHGWFAQCPLCNAWSTIETAVPISVVVDHDDDGSPLVAVTSPRDRQRIPIVADAPPNDDDAPAGDDCELPIPITAVSREHVPRFITNIPALDHVLGGGLVPGCSVLIGGEPGAGKTSLITQAAASCARWNEARVLYATAEENLGQMADRAERIGANFERFYVIRESDPDRILRSAEKIDPEVLIVDSISTLARIDLPAMPGTVTQVRACAELLHAWCRTHHVALILIGHVTKDGAVAGPNTLKHLVDTVLHLDLIEGSQLRVLRARKNRHGDTGAVGRFMMSKDGLESIGGYGPDDSETVSTSMDRLHADDVDRRGHVVLSGAAVDIIAYQNAETPSVRDTTDAPATTLDREPQDTAPVSDLPDSLHS